MYYLKSEQVKVFPCAFRGTDASGNQINPEARLNTEYSLTRRHSSGEDSYIIEHVAPTSTTDGFIKCVVGGYYFELIISSSDYVSLATTGNTACIRIKRDIKADNDIYLLPLEGTSDIPSNLDINKGSPEVPDYRFVGLGFTSDSGELQKASFSLQIYDYHTPDNGIIASSFLQYKADDEKIGIESNLKGKTITGNLISGKGTRSIVQLTESDTIEENTYTIANSAAGKHAIALGDHTTANRDNLVAIGRYNTANIGDLFVVGNGTSDLGGSRNILEVKEKTVIIGKTGDTESTLQTYGKAEIAKDTDVELSKADKTTTINGKLQINQTTSAKGTVYIDSNKITSDTAKIVLKSNNGDAIFTGNVDVKNGLDVTGAGLIVGTTTENQATTLNGNLTAIGQVTLGGTNGSVTLSKSGSTTAVQGNLTVTGETNLNGGLKLDTDKFVVANDTGNTTIAGTLGVTGNVTLNNLSINANKILTISDSTTVGEEAKIQIGDDAYILDNDVSACIGIRGMTDDNKNTGGIIFGKNGMSGANNAGKLFYDASKFTLGSSTEVSGNVTTSTYVKAGLGSDKGFKLGNNATIYYDTDAKCIKIKFN